MRISSYARDCAVLGFVIAGIGCGEVSYTGPDAGEPGEDGAQESYQVGGTVTGLEADGLVLALNDDEELSIAGNGSFAFATSLESGNDYSVEVLGHPAGQGCLVRDGEGTISDSDVDSVEVECTDRVEAAHLSVSPPVTLPGYPTSVSWSARNADACEITPEPGEATPTASGHAEVTLDEATLLSLTCEGPGGADTAEAPVRLADADWKQTTMASRHSCGLKEDGRIFCWGSGESGRLGQGSTESSNAPVQEASEAADWAYISSGADHTCALNDSGEIYCWGRGGAGQLGDGNDGTDHFQSEPTGVDHNREWTAVSAMGGHTCAIDEDSALFCWGSGGFGQLGDGNDGTGHLSSIPVQESTEATDWQSVSGGGMFTCAIDDGDELFCWGNIPRSDSDGGSAVPGEVSGSLFWEQVSGGFEHVCGVTTIGHIYCWGAGGGDGKLGAGADNTGRISEPIREALGRGDWRAVSAGNSATCAVTDDGTSYCWGDGDFIPVPESPEIDNWARVEQAREHRCGVLTSGELLCWDSDDEYGELGLGKAFRVPELVKTDRFDWGKVAAGPAHSCSITSEGELYCWGLNHRGRLGDGSEADSREPVQESSGRSDWQSVAAGGQHTCGINSSGELFCWGAARRGQLGIGEDPPTHLVDPTREVSEATNWSMVAAGDRHSCGLTNDGELFCWGRNFDGQIGDGSNDDRPEPTEIPHDADWSQVSAGDSHTCAIDDSGRIYCWGANDWGQLGDGDTERRREPVQEATEGDDWTYVTAGTQHTCALKEDGRIFCWGRGDDGRLGNDEEESAPVTKPVQEASGSENWSSVDAGDSHTCGIKTDGSMSCWGHGGRLGSGHEDNQSTPVSEKTGAIDWKHVALGRNHTCGTKTSGQLLCWSDEPTEANGLLEIRPIWPLE